MTGWRPPLREPTAAPELDQDMTAADIAFELSQLRFDSTEFRAVRMDAQVRDYLVNTLSARQPRRP